MKETRLLMGMPITIQICDEGVKKEFMETLFTYFRSIDERFSTFKLESEISKINRGEINEKNIAKK